MYNTFAFIFTIRNAFVSFVLTKKWNVSFSSSLAVLQHSVQEQKYLFIPKELYLGVISDFHWSPTELKCTFMLITIIHQMLLQAILILLFWIEFFSVG